MGFLGYSMLGWHAAVLLISLLAECRPPLVPFAGFHGQGALPARPPQQPKQPLLPVPQAPAEPKGGAKQPKIKLICHEDEMEIRVNADLFGTGVLINGQHLWLGLKQQPKGSHQNTACGAVVSGETEYTIRAGLGECGTKLHVTEDSLIYKNEVVHWPPPSPDGIIRFQNAEYPVECYYHREYNVNSYALVPTWVPFTTTQSAEDILDFSLKLMNDDWQSERFSFAYYLGEMIHLEASVSQTYHVPFRISVESCVATLSSDATSDTHYAFIANNGCLIDARLTGSRSRFLPRTQDHKLQFQLEAFRFHQDARSSIFITCFLSAVPQVFSSESGKRACSFTDGRWREADGDDQLCSSCEMFGPSSSSSTPSYDGKLSANSGYWKRGADQEPALGKVASVGPLMILSTKETASSEVLEVEDLKSSAPPPAEMATEASTAVEASADGPETASISDTTVILTPEQADSSVDTPAVLITQAMEPTHDSPFPMTQQAGDVDTLAVDAEEGPSVTLAIPAELVDLSGDTATALPATHAATVDLVTGEADPSGIPLTEAGTTVVTSPVPNEVSLVVE